MSDQDEDEDGGYRAAYDNGHWEWNDTAGALVFKSDLPEIIDDLYPPTPTNIGSIEFKEDLDLLEQQRFRKRFQRKLLDNDVIYLQDVKDIVFFTAPKAILIPAVIKIFHTPTTERFIRALLFYCQYFLQISEEMNRRIAELEFKVRTMQSDEAELEFRNNLEELRVLVAKEYSCIILGCGELAKYHHMGLKKKACSLSERDSILFESILRITIQIIWLALGRQAYNQIELEIHRLFKSDMYNIIEHKLHMKYENTFSERELFVLFGHCVHRNKVISTYSPLNNEINCKRDIDYRLFGLGAVEYPKLPHRLRYFEKVLIAPEENFACLKISLGILGLPRTRFDTMLKEIKIPTSSTASSSSSFRQSVGRVASRGANESVKKMQQKLYPDIDLPDKYEEKEQLPDRFPSQLLPKKLCNKEQRRRWMTYSTFIFAKKNKRKKSDFLKHGSLLNLNKQF